MNVVIKVDNETKKKMLEYYKDKILDKKIPYAVFQAKDEDSTITMYESGKVMFQGKSADVDASMWQEIAKVEVINKEKKKEEKNLYYIDAIGSDEVGTGDYFGPIVVTASLVKKEDIEYLESLNIRDSKTMSDQYILKIVPSIIKKIDYETLILKNKDYNEEYKKYPNINKIKAIMHNKVLYKLAKRHPDIDNIIIDEFARESSYYNYISDAKVIQKNLKFVTKAEDKNLAVAVSAIISRYVFLKELEDLSYKYKTTLLKGAGKDVDLQATKLVEKYGKDVLNDIAKVNFQNTNRVLKTVIY